MYESKTRIATGEHRPLQMPILHLHHQQVLPLPVLGLRFQCVISFKLLLGRNETTQMILRTCVVFH